MLLRYFLIVSVFIFCTCQQQEDSLEAIKNFKPEDKYFKSSLVNLHFIIETSPISRVDSVFMDVINQFRLPTDALESKDGDYFGESPYDAYDYRHQVKIRIENGKITDVDYDEVHRNGTSKQDDREYGIAMSVVGTSPDKAYPKMEKQLIESQNILDVDAVTGASYSLYRFRYAAIIALIKAKMGLKS